VDAARTLDIDIPEKILWLASKPKRVKIAVGGRGSGKSTGVGDLMLGFAARGERICCTREFQNSIDDSVHESLKAEIDRLGLDNLFEVKATEITSLYGGQVFYKGLARNITSLKSVHGVKRLWIEEGESVSGNSLKVLTPSIRSSAADNVSDITDPPEIWITMNRGSSKDAVAQKYLSRAEKQLAKTGYYEDDLIMAVQLNYNENPWFPPELEQERLDDYENLSRAEYDHIWNGHYADTVENAIIEPAWFDACVDAHKKLGFDPIGQERFAYDPADTGDAKAFAYLHGSVFLDVQETDTGEIDTATDWALSEANSIKPDVFTWDADGMGAGLKRQIEDAFKGKKVQIESFSGGGGVDRPDALYQESKDVSKAKTNRQAFKNKRAQYYWMLRERMYRTYRAVEKGVKVYDPEELISFSSDIQALDSLRAELCRIPRKHNPNGLIQILSKPEMKKLDIDSPNMADACMMAIRPVEVSTSGPAIQFEGWG
jgi:phage terminase large subunit